MKINATSQEETVMQRLTVMMSSTSNRWQQRQPCFKTCIQPQATATQECDHNDQVRQVNLDPTRPRNDNVSQHRTKNNLELQTNQVSKGCTTSLKQKKNQVQKTKRQHLERATTVKKMSPVKRHRPCIHRYMTSAKAVRKKCQLRQNEAGEDRVSCRRLRTTSSNQDLVDYNKRRIK